MADKTMRDGGEAWRTRCIACLRAGTAGDDDPRHLGLG
jgi:hypothetical protein